MVDHRWRCHRGRQKTSPVGELLQTTNLGQCISRWRFRCIRVPFMSILRNFKIQSTRNLIKQRHFHINTFSKLIVLCLLLFFQLTMSIHVGAQMLVILILKHEKIYRMRVLFVSIAEERRDFFLIKKRK